MTQKHLARILAMATAAGLIATAATAPALAFHGSKTHHRSVAKDAHWKSAKHISPARARHWRTYGVHIRSGFPPNCRQLERRAYLTGNAYWRYAANSCRFDVYKYY